MDCRASAERFGVHQYALTPSTLWRHKPPFVPFLVKVVSDVIALRCLQVAPLHRRAGDDSF